MSEPDDLTAKVTAVIEREYAAADPLGEGFKPAASTLARDVMAVVDTRRCGIDAPGCLVAMTAPPSGIDWADVYDDPDDAP